MQTAWTDASCLSTPTRSIPSSACRTRGARVRSCYHASTLTADAAFSRPQGRCSQAAVRGSAPPTHHTVMTTLTRVASFDIEHGGGDVSFPDRAAGVRSCFLASVGSAGRLFPIASDRKAQTTGKHDASLHDLARARAIHSGQGHSRRCQWPALAAGYPPNVYQISPLAGQATLA